MKLVNKETGSQYVFTLNDWVKTNDDLDTWREVAADTTYKDDKLDGALPIINGLIK